MTSNLEKSIWAERPSHQSWTTTIALQFCASVAFVELRFLCDNIWNVHGVGESLRPVVKEFLITHNNHPERSL